MPTESGCRPASSSARWRHANFWKVASPRWNSTRSRSSAWGRGFESRFPLQVPYLQSGTSVHKPARISRRGNRHIRRGLFMPTLVAEQYEPHVKAFYENLLTRDKSKMQANVAVMRKPLHVIYGSFPGGFCHSGRLRTTRGSARTDGARRSGRGARPARVDSGVGSRGGRRCASRSGSRGAARRSGAAPRGGVARGSAC